jgi:hypothetical protein
MAFSRSALHPTPSGESLRVGMVQSNLVDYEQRRHESGAHAVVREVLDTHFAMTYDAVERQRADAVLWSETVYPTTFGNPKSEAGAEFDAAIQTIVNAAKVPFVFGTYDRDARGEYNAAAFVLPETGLLGFYRKTRLFPLTEYVPHWLDGPALRRWLPWTGSWLAGDGARVFPLRLKDGREVPVMTAICLDDVDTTAGDRGRPPGRAGDPDPVQRLLVHPLSAGRSNPSHSGGVSQHRNRPAAVPGHIQWHQRGDRRHRRGGGRLKHGRAHSGGRATAGATAPAHLDGDVGRLVGTRGRRIPGPV